MGIYPYTHRPRSDHSVLGRAAIGAAAGRALCVPYEVACGEPTTGVEGLTSERSVLMPHAIICRRLQRLEAACDLLQGRILRH